MSSKASPFTLATIRMHVWTGDVSMEEAPTGEFLLNQNSPTWCFTSLEVHLH